MRLVSTVEAIFAHRVQQRLRHGHHSLHSYACVIRSYLYRSVETAVIAKKDKCASENTSIHQTFLIQSQTN